METPKEQKANIETVSNMAGFQISSDIGVATIYRNKDGKLMARMSAGEDRAVEKQVPRNEAKTLYTFMRGFVR